MAPGSTLVTGYLNWEVFGNNITLGAICTFTIKAFSKIITINVIKNKFHLQNKPKKFLQLNFKLFMGNNHFFLVFMMEKILNINFVRFLENFLFPSKKNFFKLYLHK